MTTGKTFWLAASVVIVMFALFDVSFPLDVASPHDVEVPDPATEAEYQRCYKERDEALHHLAFSTIDNPDVQKEFIITNREKIARECRGLIPEQVITVREPSRFNIIDLKPRFW